MASVAFDVSGHGQYRCHGVTYYCAGYTDEQLAVAVRAAQRKARANAAEWERLLGAPINWPWLAGDADEQSAPTAAAGSKSGASSSRASNGRASGSGRDSGGRGGRGGGRG